MQCCVEKHLGSHIVIFIMIIISFPCKPDLWNSKWLLIDARQISNYLWDGPFPCKGNGDYHVQRSCCTLNGAGRKVPCFIKGLTQIGASEAVGFRWGVYLASDNIVLLGGTLHYLYTHSVAQAVLLWRKSLTAKAYVGPNVHFQRISNSVIGQAIALTNVLHSNTNIPLECM